MPIPLLEARDLKKHFPVTRGLLLARTTGMIKAVDGIDFQIWPGQTVSLVGESGCGKTTTARTILRLETATSGSLTFEGQEVSSLKGDDLRRFRASVQAVFQDPFSSFNPRMQVGSSIIEPLAANVAVSRAQRKATVRSLLEQVGLNPEAGRLYPHEFSGGQRQRLAIARALSVNPRLVILDEPVSGLDVSIRAQIMNLLKDLQTRFGLAYLLIAHDLSTVRYMSTSVLVMYLGRIVESGPSEAVFSNPLHPYTEALLAAALPSHPSRKRKRVALPGEVPSPVNPPSGCAFHPRCRRAMDGCAESAPRLRGADADHSVACHLLGRPAVAARP